MRTITTRVALGPVFSGFTRFTSFGWLTFHRRRSLSDVAIRLGLIAPTFVTPIAATATPAATTAALAFSGFGAFGRAVHGHGDIAELIFGRGQVGGLQFFSIAQQRNLWLWSAGLGHVRIGASRAATAAAAAVASATTTTASAFAAFRLIRLCRAFVVFFRRIFIAGVVW